MGVSETGDHRRRLAPEVRRERLLEAATTIFAERGYEGTRVEQIADKAGVSPGLLYRHFPGKRELYEEVAKLGGQKILELAAEAAAPGPEGARRLESGLDTFFRFVEEHHQIWRMLMRDEPDPAVAGIRDAIYAQAVTVVRDLVAIDPDAKKQQDLHEFDLEMIAVMIVGAAELLANWWVTNPDVKRSQIVQTTVATLWLGLDRLRTGERYSR